MTALVSSGRAGATLDGGGSRAARPVAPSFARLDERNDWWYSPVSVDVVGDRADGGLRLGSREQRPVPFTEPGGTFGGLTRPTGLALGPDGRLFLADPGQDRILTYTPHDATFRPLWSSGPLPQGAEPGPYDLEAPRGVSFSPAGDLIVADTGHGRVLVYAWPSLQVRRVISLPAGGEPWDLDHDAGGNLYVADSAAGRVWRYNSAFWRDAEYHGGAPVLQRPRHLAVSTDGRVFVVDEGLVSVYALDSRGRIHPDFEVEDLLAGILPPALSLEAQTLYIPQDRRPDCPRLALPGIEVDRTGRLPTVGAMLLARPLGVQYPRSGHYVSLTLDSGTVNCQWHRVVLDAVMPARTSISVRTLTAAADMEPARVDTLPLERWSTPITVDAGAMPEVLVQSGPGRYLWLRLELVGDGEATPLVRAITVFSPRHSSLNYLPPVFQDDPVSANFVDRLLSYFDTVFAEIETEVERFPAYLDPDSAPAEFLDWLGAWLDLRFLAQWPEETRRDFIRRAIEYYKRRGTVEGLREFLQLHTGLTGTQPAVIEHFRLGDFAHRLDAGADALPEGRLYIGGYPLEPGDDELAHHFTLVLPSAAAPDDDALATLRQLVELQKPAHTAFQVRLFQPGFRVGCQSTVGVDTLVGEYPSAPVGELRLGQSGRLDSPDDTQPKLGSTRLTSG
jgi:phage tail-like protein